MCLCFLSLHSAISTFVVIFVRFVKLPSNLSIEEASEVANAALQVLVVGTICIKKALIAGAVHASILRRIFGLHVGVLGGASPVDKVFSGLESRAHD